MRKNLGEAADHIAESLAVYNKWKDDWGTPVMQAIYGHNFDEARALLIAAKDDLSTSKLPEDVIEGLSYLTLYITCRLEWDTLVNGYSQEDYDKVIAWLSIPAKTSFGNYIRAGYLIAIRCNGTSDSYDQLTRKEVDELLAPLPGLIAVTAWQHLARWAFERRDIEILTRAFEIFLLYPDNIMSQARWQRVNLMYQLLAGKASRRDVIESIKVLEIKPQLQEFKHELWPECVKLGLVDAELEQMLADKEALVLARKTGPGFERKTKSLLGKGERP